MELALPSLLLCALTAAPQVQVSPQAKAAARQITEASLASGVRDLRRSALDKVKQGVTSLVEINRVTKD